MFRIPTEEDIKNVKPHPNDGLYAVILTCTFGVLFVAYQWLK